ncbi:hypothetical protein Q7P37_000462 [Cladosporium fusiforme]
MHTRPALLHTLILACAIFPATQAFQLTGPDTAEKLDLTKPITVSWDATEGTLSEPNARILDLWFHAVFSGDNRDRAGWMIATNLSLASTNSYEWDPSGIAKLIEDNDQTLSPEAVHTFEARLLDQDGERLARVESDGYALDGVDFISDSGSGDGARAGVYGATVAAAAITAAELVAALL